MMRPRTPQRERSGRTPNRERPPQQNAGQSNLPVEVVLQAYAAHFPALPRDQTALPRGRKERRGACPWDDLGGCDSRASSRSCSRGHFREEDVEEERPVGRARACSFDMAADSTERSEKDSRPTTPRGSILKKPRNSIGDGDAEKAKLAEIKQQELQEKMKELMALMGPGSDTQTHLATQLTKLLDSAATQLTDENKATSAEDTTKDVTTRRLSNPSTPRSMEAPPGGSSWEYPLTKEEKKARIVMISSAEIECLTEENHSLTEEMARLNIGSSR